MFRSCLATCLLILLAFAARSALAEAPRSLTYAPAPVDNPLKGLVPYQGDVRSRFPHSLEFNYLPYSALVKGYDKFDWNPLEALLDDIASRGNQAVLRIFLEYPGKRGGIPEFLIQDGLKVMRWDHDATRPESAVETPDYANGNLRRSLKGFLAAFGKKYDGDPRIGFITAGLLGLWGEWHTYPREELFAGKETQAEVLNAYEAAFKITPVLLRYPTGEHESRKAPNADRKFGYHDDSFAWATLHTGKKSDAWFYMTSLQAAGPAAEAKWQRHPIGGEIRPEAWGVVFDAAPKHEHIQDFRQCVEAAHASWLLDSGMFRKKQSAERIQRAEAEVRRMGYEFHAPTVRIEEAKDGKLAVSLTIENRGVAPFYYDWKPQYGLLRDGNAIQSFAGSGKLIGLLPGDAPRMWADVLDVSGVKAGEYLLAVRVANPLKGGKPMRFANAEQDADAPGWLSLGKVRIR